MARQFEYFLLSTARMMADEKRSRGFFQLRRPNPADVLHETFDRIGSEGFELIQVESKEFFGFTYDTLCYFQRSKD